MRSGNGRHRRPRRAPAFFVTAGVTGAGLAMPLLAAGGAQAADGTTWDRVAECESGGLWSANTGNGYYGGLQLTLETWAEYGGTVLAARPDLASRGQQIEIAEKILADQGPQAWPSCSISAGLLPDEPDVEVPDLPGAPDVELPDAPELPDTEVPETEVPDTEVPETDVPDGSGLPDGPDDDATEGSGDGDPAGGSTDGSSGGSTDDDSAPPVPDVPSGTGSGIGEPGQETGTQAPDAPDARDGEGDGTGRHRGDPDDRPRDDAADRPSRGKHGKPGDSDRSERSGESAHEDSYRVRPGDSLSAIAAEREVRGGWTSLYEQNRDTVGDDPDLILPGQLLDLRTGGELR